MNGVNLKILLIGLIAITSLTAFAEPQEICRLDIYKTEIFGEMDGKVMKGKRMNADHILLPESIFPQEIVILSDADNDVLGFYKQYSSERAEYSEMRKRKDINENSLTVRVLKRYIYEKVYLNIQSDMLSLDIPVLADQKIRLSIPMGKDIFLKCEN